MTHSEPLLLGLDCGATHSVAILADSSHRKIWRGEAGPGNVRLLSDPELKSLFKTLRPPKEPAAIGIGMAGARTDHEKARIRRAASAVWPRLVPMVTNDLETALATLQIPGQPPAMADPRVLILSGTGSCCYGIGPDGNRVRLGGWGHLLGDKGSGYEIGMRALKAVVYYYDRDGQWPALGARLLRVLMLNEPDDLIGWVQTARKEQIARLAREVFEARSQKDSIARDILEGAASSLAKDGMACAKRLVKRGGSVTFLLSGSILTKQPGFAKDVSKKLRASWPQAQVVVQKRESAWGAVAIALEHLSGSAAKPSQDPRSQPKRRRQESSDSLSNRTDPAAASLRRSLLQSPTEQRNRRSRRLDEMPVPKAIELMLSEESKVPTALLGHVPDLEKGVRLITRALRHNGRLFYVGAGTSGRLGVLDASECPPTFHAPPEWVQGIMAGGQRALWEAVEGAEDDPEAGARAVRFRGVSRKDVVVGIAASGRTPFVWGALKSARSQGAKTILVCFNPNLEIPAGQRPTVLVAVNVGPEILTGSTRLKAGTATKMVLNIFTTLTMVQLGKVRSNLMVDVKATNTKLRDRAIRIVRDLTQASEDQARTALERARWRIPKACDALKRNRKAKSGRP